ncbi:MAG: histidine phosphatase family protein [Anaerolineae bacterium]|nr:histidine phosphatase family protein [Anaerolineae bacterium]
MNTNESPATHLIFVRHGQSLVNRDGSAAITEDGGLTELGWQQAHLVADWLGHNYAADALLCSSMQRAVQTAEVIGQQLGLQPEIWPGFDETRVPYWTEFPTAPDAPLAGWDHPWQPDATNAPMYTQFRQQLRATMAMLMERYLGRTVVIVSHGGTIGTIIRSLFGGHQMPIFTENGGVTHLVWQEGRWRLISHNERAHLGDTSLPALTPWSEPGPLRTIVEQFGRAAAMYPLTPDPATAEQLRALVALAAPRPTDHLLAVVTAAGAAALAFAPHVAHVTAIDVAPAMLERAELARLQAAVNNVAIRWADAAALPYPAATFDLAVCRDLLGYFAEPGPLCEGLRRVLRAEGKLLLDELVGSEDPVKRATHQALEMQRDPAIARLYAKTEIEQALHKAGFHLEQVEVYEITHSETSWLATTPLTAEERELLLKRLHDSSEEDAADLRIRRSKSGHVTFTVRRLRVLARPANR